jgi:hypothetical protein
VIEERTKDMIYETLKSVGDIIETKEHDQEIIVALMSVKCHIGDVFLFHMYPMVAKTKVKFGQALIPTEFIQKIMYDGNG